MDVDAYLDQVAYRRDGDIPSDYCDIHSDDYDYKGMVYYSKFDDSYITLVGLEEDVAFLAELGITDELSRGVGFSPSHNKWYGWSHRGICGFEIGSTCTKRDVHYNPANIDEALKNDVEFWDDEYHEYTAGTIVYDNEIKLTWKYNDKVPNEKLRGTVGSRLIKHESFGRGEWTAKTMADAKQMAIDYNENIS